uniref:Uracil phosphoribosyltransferase n=1 Tax=Laurenciella marilzae TaxID=1413812 RepID=A0A1Z1M1X0_9FLOR|nr:uracil phosphoribosyltransferase [Laurenciella marilzae]ARW59892.1 uracil phosphoribosyltransferase [Laurenciella marilzae]
MQLKIYSISHPIIQILSNITTTEKKNPIISYCHYKNLGLLLMYEILRKYVKVQTIYIKLLYSTKQLKLTDYNDRYLVITDLSNNYEIISNVKTLIPNIEIVNISYINTIDKKNLTKHREAINEHTQIFILEEQLENIKIIDLITYLTSTQKIPIDNINLVCVKSKQTILKQIGNIYPNVKVYTTQILYNK